MEELTNLFNFSNHIFQLLIAVSLGAFVGIRREFNFYKNEKQGFFGIRTSALVVSLGTLSTFFEKFEFLPILFFIILGIMVAIVYENGVKNGKIGLTSEISILLIYWAGVLIGYEEFILGIVLALLVAISEEYKEKMHKFAAKLKIKEWVGTLQMIIISLVILPFLPKEAIDKWGIIVPYNIWFLVVLMSGISFVGYFLNKVLKDTKVNGLYLTSFLGSLVSSTAVTVQLSHEIKKENLENSGKIKSNKKAKTFVSAILLAISVMQMRVVILIVLATQNFNFSIVAPPLIMSIISFLLFLFYVFLKKEKEEENKNHEIKIKIEEKSPMEILPALLFALIFVIMSFVIYFVNKWIGENGVYVAAVLTAISDVESIILPSLESFRKGIFNLKLISNIVAIAVIMNTIVKLFYIYFFAGRQHFFKILFPVLIVIFFGFVVLFI